MKEQLAIPVGGNKIDEYVKRIQAGEKKESIMQGLPQSWVSMIENRLDKVLDKGDKVSAAPAVATPEVVDHAQKQKEEQEKIEVLRSKLGVTETVKNERKKLSGWTASYELAKIAKKEGVDLSALSREEYVEYAVKNHLAIDDAQLRAYPSQRNGTSVEEVMQMMKQEKTKINPESEKNFARFSYEMMQLAQRSQQERFLSQDVRVLSGTKDSNSWIFFSINNGANDKDPNTFKSYFAMKDLNKLTPDRFKGFMKYLQEHGYNGGVKIFQDMTEQGTKLNDQVVMHGFSEQDSKLALKLAGDYFKGELASESFGKDEMVDGKSKSYSQLLAEQIQKRVIGS